MDFYCSSFRAPAVALAVAALAGAVHASVITYNFTDITHNDPAAAAAGEAQLYVDISPAPNSQVSFTFHNEGPVLMSITDIYFQDGPILGLATILDGPGTDFESGAQPNNLPGSNLAVPAFQATQAFSAQSQPPVQPLGVNPGEHVELRYTLISGKTVADIQSDLQSGALRIGLHVQGFPSGVSESFVNNVPTPGAIAILSLGGLLMLRRKR